MSKHQARCVCGWKGEWTVDALYAKDEGAAHTRKFEKALEELGLVMPGNEVYYVKRA